MVPNDIVSSLIAVQMGGTGGKAKAKTITKNGAYAITDEEKSEGYVGYSPLNVNVPTGANIIPLTVIEPGTYNAADYGCDGFDPVNVSDMYKKLYEQATGGGDSIDSGVTDPNGDEVILDNAIETDWDAIKCIEIDAGELTLTEPNTGLQLKFYAVISGDSKSLYAKLTNLKTGKSVESMASRANYTISSGERITFKIIGYELSPGYFQVYPGDVYLNGALYPNSYYAHWYPYYYSSTVGISGGFTSGSVIIQATY